MTDSILDFLKEHEKETQEVSAPEGALICLEGTQCSELIILTEGNVRVFKPSLEGKSIGLYSIEPGGSCVLTAGCIFNAAPFPAIAEARTDVKGIAVPANNVIQWMSEYDVWRNYLFSLLNIRLADVISLVNTLAFQQLDARLASWLLRTQSNNIVEMTHQEIAEELASSREVVSRLLKDLENSGFIQLSRGKLSILVNEALRRLSSHVAG